MAHLLIPQNTKYRLMIRSVGERERVRGRDRNGECKTDRREE